MSERRNILDGATIRYDGAVGHELPDVFNICVVETRDGPFWFEYVRNFFEKGNDFCVSVRNFGLRRRSSAGSKTPIVRRSFHASDAEAARARLEAFFLEPPQPFRGKSRGTLFPDGWVTVNYDEALTTAAHFYHVLFVDTAKGAFWLELDYQHVARGPDFQVSIKTFIGSAPVIPIFPPQSFTPAQARSAQALVKAALLDTPNSAPVRFAPFRIGAGRCIGVNFAEGWITTLIERNTHP